MSVYEDYRNDVKLRKSGATSKEIVEPVEYENSYTPKANKSNSLRRKLMKQINRLSTSSANQGNLLRGIVISSGAAQSL